MKIILNVDRNMASGWKKAGDLVELADNLALRWINAGIVRYPDIGEIKNSILSPVNYWGRNKFFDHHALKNYIEHRRVTIIIPVLNALKYLKQCLETLIKFTQNYELVIIDNGSNSETKEYLSKCRKELGFKLQTNEKNMGFSYACNQGIKIATCDYICFLNSDTVLTPNWLGKLMKGFSMPKAGIVGPSTCWCGSKQCMRELINKRMRMTLSDIIAVKPGFGIIETEIFGFCYLVAKKVINDIGVFDYERYPVGSCEERDFSWRAGKAGYKSYHVKDSYVHHFGSKTFDEMGIKPNTIRIVNVKAFDKRKSDGNIYVENTAQIDNFIDNQTEIIPILMIVLNRLEYTQKSIEAIFKNTLYPFSLFIFNNDSDDKTTEYLKSLDDYRIEIYNSRMNLGLALPMNMFFDKFKYSKYVAKVDNDTIVQADWLSKLKEVMDTYPLFTVQANHYLAMPFKIKTNDDFYKHLFSVDFNDSKIYLYHNGGGTGQLIRREIIDKPIPENKGSLSGWCNLQYEKYRQWPSAFYTGVWVDRLDQSDTNKYKEVSDYPEYDKMISKMRPYGLGYSEMNIVKLEKIKKEMETWFKKNDYSLHKLL